MRIEDDQSGEATEIKVVDILRVGFIVPLPPSVNDYWKQGWYQGKKWVYLSKEAKAYKKSVMDKFKELGASKLQKWEVLRLVATIYYETDRDIDNSLKAFLDSLQGVLFENDSQIRSLSLDIEPADKRHMPGIVFRLERKS